MAVTPSQSCHTPACATCPRNSPSRPWPRVPQCENAHRATLAAGPTWGLQAGCYSCTGKIHSAPIQYFSNMKNSLLYLIWCSLYRMCLTSSMIVVHCVLENQYSFGPPKNILPCIEKFLVSRFLLNEIYCNCPNQTCLKSLGCLSNFKCSIPSA